MSYSGLNKGVFDKMPKQEVELSSEVVELGLSQDADKAVTDFYNSYGNAVSKIKGAISSLREAGVAFEKAEGKASILEDFESKLEQAAKELGVDTSNWQIVKDLKGAQNTAKEVSKYIKTIDKAISSL